LQLKRGRILALQPDVKDPAKRWSLVQANEACSTEIQRKRWASVLAMPTYEQRERDHGHASCMKSKLADKG
jgi:hypothetical protein